MFNVLTHNTRLDILGTLKTTFTHVELMNRSRILNTEILFHLLVRYIKPELICDIGALDASHSILLRKISREAKIIAFEANPYNYQAILRNDIPKLANIEVFHKAISNMSGQLKFHVQKLPGDERDHWMAGTSSILQRNQNIGETEEVEVEAVRLDDFIQTVNAPCNSIALWIDTEGAGYEVLNGIKGIAENIIFLQVEVETEEIWQGQKLKNEIQKLMVDLEFIEVGRGKHEDQHDLVYVNRKYFSANKAKCKILIRAAIFFSYLRKWGGHILSDILLIPFLGTWRK